MYISRSNFSVQRNEKTTAQDILILPNHCQKHSCMASPPPNLHAAAYGFSVLELCWVTLVQATMNAKQLAYQKGPVWEEASSGLKIQKMQYMSCSNSISKKFDSGDLESTRYVQFRFKVSHLSPSLQSYIQVRIPLILFKSLCRRVVTISRKDKTRTSFITHVHRKRTDLLYWRKIISCCQLRFIRVVMLICRLALLPIMKIKKLKNDLCKMVKGCLPIVQLLQNIKCRRVQAHRWTKT
jgi:hypothetical protein